MQKIKDFFSKISFLLGIFCMFLVTVVIIHPRMSLSPALLVIMWLIQTGCMMGAGEIQWSKEENKKIFSYIRYVFMILFYCALLWQLVLGNDMFDRIQHTNDFNVIPFKTILQYIKQYRAGNIRMYLVFLNLMGNIALLAPIGFYLGISDLKMKWFTPVAVGGICSLIIEMLQMYMGKGSFDVDDILLNLIGVVLLYGITNLCNIKIRK